jgi:hypothetical protein
MPRKDKSRSRRSASGVVPEEQEAASHKELMVRAPGAGARRFPLQGKPHSESPTDESPESPSSEAPPSSSAPEPGSPPNWRRGPAGFMGQPQSRGQFGGAQGFGWQGPGDGSGQAPPGGIGPPRQGQFGQFARFARQGFGGPGMAQRDPFGGRDQSGWTGGRDQPANWGGGQQDHAAWGGPAAQGWGAWRRRWAAWRMQGASSGQTPQEQGAGGQAGAGGRAWAQGPRLWQNQAGAMDQAGGGQGRQSGGGGARGGAGPGWQGPGRAGQMWWSRRQGQQGGRPGWNQGGDVAAELNRTGSETVAGNLPQSASTESQSPPSGAQPRSGRRAGPRGDESDTDKS